MPPSLTARERVFRALDFRAPDVIPLRIFAAPGGLYEHGQKLVDLIRACGHDFGSFENLALPPKPGADDFDPDGRYHAFRTDDWGTRWEYRIYGVWGHPVGYALNDLSQLDSFRPPAPPPASGPAFDAARAQWAEWRRTWFHLEEVGSLFEKMHSLHPFDNVLCDVFQNTAEMNQLADRIQEYNRALVHRALALDADAVLIGDDWGTQQALFFPPEVWRRFFRPRYRELFAPVLAAGKRVFLHSCGQIGALLDDLRDVGITVVWPQMPLYKPADLARRCRALGVALELHPDRGELMQHGSPQRIRDYVLRLVDDVGAAQGGSWLYIEIDPGFPWPNVEALFNVAMELRR